MTQAKPFSPSPSPSTLPPEAFAQHIAILGKTGSGKTTTAKGFAESLLNSGKRVCVIDPTGVWWGLRLRADGHTPGYAVVIFGGAHVDVPNTHIPMSNTLADSTAPTAPLRLHTPATGIPAELAGTNSGYSAFWPLGTRHASPGPNGRSWHA